MPVPYVRAQFSGPRPPPHRDTLPGSGRQPAEGRAEMRPRTRASRAHAHKAHRCPGAAPGDSLATSRPPSPVTNQHPATPPPSVTKVNGSPTPGRLASGTPSPSPYRSVVPRVKTGGSAVPAPTELSKFVHKTASHASITYLGPEGSLLSSPPLLLAVPPTPSRAQPPSDLCGPPAQLPPRAPRGARARGRSFDSIRTSVNRILASLPVKRRENTSNS